MIIENYVKECSYEEFLAFLIEENEEREVEEADYDFLLNPENIGCCNGCPENMLDWSTLLQINKLVDFDQFKKMYKVKTKSKYKERNGETWQSYY